MRHVEISVRDKLLSHGVPVPREMIRLRFWRIAWKIAWRDLWSGRRHFVVALTTLAVGVGAMSAARSVGDAFSRRLNGDMRQWIAADVAVTLRQPPSEEQRGELDELARHGIEETESFETYTMASSDQAADPVAISIKSVDPRRYPWYGRVELDPVLPLGEALQPDTAVISRTLAERLSVVPGNRILIDGVDFRVAALIAGEPDRFAAAPNAYPRAMLSGEAFDRSQIARQGNSISWRLLFRIGAGRATAGLKAQLQQMFPDAQVVDYRDRSDPRAAAALNAAVTYLDMAAWNALVLGSLGVAMVIYLHIEQRLDTVAVMKVLGGRWSQILVVYLLEIGGLSLAGCAIGAVLAIPLERMFLLLSRGQSLVPVALPWRWSQAGVAVGLGMLASLMATAMPLAAVRAAPPLLLLRRHVQRPTGRWRIGLLSLLGLVVLAGWMVHSWKAGAAYLFGKAAGALILLGAGCGLVRLLRRAARHWKIQGLMNLGRPGLHGETRFLALAVGIMGVTASWLAPAAVIRAIEQSLPLPGADLFVFGFGPDQKGPLIDLLSRNPDVKQPVDLLPLVVLRLSKVAGVPASASAPERWAATCSAAAPSAPTFSGALVAIGCGRAGGRDVRVFGRHAWRESRPDARFPLEWQSPSGAHRGSAPHGRHRGTTWRAGLSVHSICWAERFLWGWHLDKKRARACSEARDFRQLSQHCGNQPAGTGGSDRIGGVRCHLESARDHPADSDRRNRHPDPHGVGRRKDQNSRNRHPQNPGRPALSSAERNAGRVRLFGRTGGFERRRDGQPVREPAVVGDFSQAGAGVGREGANGCDGAGRGDRGCGRMGVDHAHRSPEALRHFAQRVSLRSGRSAIIQA